MPLRRRRLLLQQPRTRDGFRERGVLGHLSFWGPRKVWSIWPFVWKAWKCAPLMCTSPSKIYLLRCQLDSTIALDLQQKLKRFLNSSSEQMAMRSFIGIYSSFV